MEAFEIKRTLAFDAGHRLKNHESKCAYIHGHRYTVHAYARPKEGLDSLGRVIDFSSVKQKLGSWIDVSLDHQLILNHLDDELIEKVSPWCKFGSPFIMPYNPTAENIGKFLLQKCQELFKDDNIEVFKIVVDETPNCSASVTSVAENL